MKCKAHQKSPTNASLKIAGGRFGMHWPKIDEDLSTEGLLRRASKAIVA